MSKWINEIKKLEAGEPVTEEDYYFMRSSDEIYLALMEVTRGNDDAITSGIVPQILERAKEIVRKDVERKYQSEHDKRIETEAAMSYLRAEDVRRETERKNRIHGRSLQFAKNTVNVLRIAILLFLVLGVALTLPLNFIASDEVVTEFFSILPQFVLPMLFFVMLVAGVWGTYNGTAVNSLLNSLEVEVEKRVFKLLWSLSS